MPCTCEGLSRGQKLILQVILPCTVPVSDTTRILTFPFRQFGMEPYRGQGSSCRTFLQTQRMTLIEQLADEQTWNEFFSYKQQLGHLSQQHEKELQQFIGEKAYLEVLDRIRAKGFSLPQKRLISKVNSDKKRVVYTCPTAENYLLKLLTYLLIRRYDRLFAPNLYSFRARHGVKRAIQFLRGAENLSAKFAYKVDIHDYFNSVDVELLLPRLQRIMADETECFHLIADLLTNPQVVLPDGQITCERKGIMAGVPLASFLANLYLNDLDWHFHRQGMLYARYSDDIILFASSAEEREMAIDYLHDYLQAHRSDNQRKEGGRHGAFSEMDVSGGLI